jgi:hypothetical protein
MLASLSEFRVSVSEDSISWLASSIFNCSISVLAIARFCSILSGFLLEDLAVCYLGTILLVSRLYFLL